MCSVEREDKQIYLHFITLNYVRFVDNYVTHVDLTKFVCVTDCNHKNIQTVPQFHSLVSNYINILS